MRLDELAATVREQGLILSYSQGYATLAFRYRLPADLRRQIRNHRRGLARLMLQGDVRLCPAPGLHRKEWYYAGRGRYACRYCIQLDVAQLGIWQKVS